MAKIKDILKNEIQSISPTKSELKAIGDKTKIILDALRANISKSKITAEVFVGGSFAKNTLIKKAKYDVDIFVRFDAKYGDQISGMLEKIVPKNSKKIHGSRDYFSIKEPSENVEFEIIPTIKVSNPLKAQNITDLSYFHVKYLASQTKTNMKLVDEIRLAKAFAYYQGCYGAESYINGFSGYAVELLIINYKTFLRFLEAVVKLDSTKDKLILDPQKLFKNKKAIEQEMNESKMNGPIILIDPTFKDRNALAALSNETFLKFQKSAKAFLKNPSEKFFEITDSEKLMRAKYKDIIELKLSTDKQAGDIAGTKLKKFYGFMIQEMDRFFDIAKHEFFYDESNNSGKILLSLKSKAKIEFSGPPIRMIEPLARFKKEHKKIIIKNGQAFAYEPSMSFDKFLFNFMNQRRNVLDAMDITNIEKI